MSIKCTVFFSVALAKTTCLGFSTGPRIFGSFFLKIQLTKLSFYDSCSSLIFWPGYEYLHNNDLIIAQEFVLRGWSKNCCCQAQTKPMLNRTETEQALIITFGPYWNNKKDALFNYLIYDKFVANIGSKGGITEVPTLLSTPRSAK